MTDPGAADDRAELPVACTLVLVVSSPAGDAAAITAVSAVIGVSPR